MSNFSLYEILSYLLPGYLMVALLRFTLAHYQVDTPIELSDEFEDSLPTLVLSMIIGIAIHMLTFKFLKWSWFKKKVYFTEQSHIASSNELKEIIPTIKEYYYSRSKEHPSMDEKSEISSIPTYLFDHCYYYLEVKGKDQQTKSFQSFYFLLRNILTIEILGWILFLIITTITIFGYTDKGWLFPSLLLVSLLFSMPLTISTARFMRGKMIDRAFWGYYVDLLYPNK